MNDLDETETAIASLLSHRSKNIPVPGASLTEVRRRARQRRTHLRASAGAAGLVLLGAATGLTQLRGDRTTRIVTPAMSSTTQPETVRSSLIDPLKMNSSGPAVAAMQTRLKELGFDPGPVDGFFGSATLQAVWAFEALVQTVTPGATTGVVTDGMWQIMQDQIAITPRRLKSQIYGERSTHIEIYLTEQVLIVFTDDTPVLITHISSGADASKTPAGIFAFYARQEQACIVVDVEQMWNPVFFNFGIGVYGSPDVPRTASSDGGIRIPMQIADYFPSLVQNKDRVYIWDGAREPEEFSRDERQTSTEALPSAARQRLLQSQNWLEQVAVACDPR